MTRSYYFALVSARNLALLMNRSRVRLETRRLCRDLGKSIVPNLHRALSVVLMVSLLTTSTPAAAQTVVGVGKEWHASLGFWLRANHVPEKLYRALSGQHEGPSPQERQQERDGRVSEIKIFPENITLQIGQKVSLAAVAYDDSGATVGGVNVKWSAQGEGRNSRAHVTPQGDFEALAPGNFKVVAEAAGQKAQVKVTVLDVGRPIQKEKPLGTKRVSTRDLPAEGSSKKIERKSDRRAAHASSVAPMPLLLPEGWGDENYWSADDPGNGRGDPPGHPVDNGSGSGNFQLHAPLLGLSGRGMDLSLALAYNSRVWNKANSAINFDIDRDWPAPGWSLGFGKLVGLGVYNGSMLVDADGTRHGFTGNITIYNGGTYFVGHTTDGTFIDYSYWTGTGGVLTSAQATLANGTLIQYYAQGTGALYPTRITDPNGNFITITYVNNTGPRIQTVTDTLSRVINFHYDSYNLLTAITTPALGSGARTLARLHYHQISLTSSSYSFSGLTPAVRDSAPWVLDAIYYPGTNTGYWFGDSDSFSSYGMLAKVLEMRAMTFNGPAPVPAAQGPTEQGTITAGQMTRKEVYNYPLFVGDTSGTPSSDLTDAPTYTTKTESWTRDGSPNNLDSATFNFLNFETATNPSQPSIPSRKVEVTLPNGTKSIQYSYKYTSLPDSDLRKSLDGLVYQDETRDSAGTLIQTSVSTWERGAYDAPRVLRTEITNDRNQTTATAFTYGSVYNQVTEVRNYDYDGTTVLNYTNTEYQNSALYTSRHIFSLPLLVEIRDGSYNRKSRTEYQYDGQLLTARPDVTQHDLAYNPHADAEGYCYTEPDWSDPDCGGSCNPELMGCDGYCPEIYYCPYNQATDYRGNVTQITTYADAATPSAPVNETYRYDITGNIVTSSTACCEQTSFNYTVDTQYAYPQSQTRGSVTDPYMQLTTSATYDFNTGLALSATDPNGRASQTSYFADTLRPQSVTLPSGGHTELAYDDPGLNMTTTTYRAPSDTGALAGQNVRFLNGRGQVRQEKSLGVGGAWDIVDTIYDSMGRVSQQSSPHGGGDTPQWTTTAYDAVSRAVRTTAADGSVTETYFNERDFDTNDSYTPTRPDAVNQNTPGDSTLMRDAWGRERWGRTDALGKLVEVVEPNPSGNGSVATGGLVTTYTYNTQGKLTGIIQGAQTRSFKFDSLGRLVAQKLAEASPMLNDAGAYQTSGGTWSEVFTYDERSNLTSETDARGVKTVYNFNNDPLNRLQSVSWDTSGFGDTTNPILQAATVSYAYRTKNSPSHLRDITQVSTVTTAGVSTEAYDFDSEGRINYKTLTLTSRPSHPFVTDYIHDSLSRTTDVRYPTEYGNGSAPRKLAHFDYDIASRLTGVTVDGQSHASQVVYNAASQATAVSVGVSGPNQILESYNYDTQTGLLSGQTVARSSAPTSWLVNLSYDHANASGRRTGQLTKILNNLNHNKDRGYSYDALGRLSQATGGPSGTLWTQNYSYDRYGNRTSVSASGNSAKAGSVPGGNPAVREGAAGSTVAASKAQSVPPTNGAPAEPKVILPTEQLAAKMEVEVPESLRRDAPRSLSDSSFHHGSRTAPAQPLTPQGPPVFTDDPLVAGVTTIKAVHVTELRTAVNQARALGGLGAAAWTDPTLAGTTVKAVHITELRARLAEARAALGLSVASYTDPTLTAGSTVVKAVHIQELRQRVTETLAGPAGCPPGQNLTIDLFVKNFYQGALARQPNATELQSWTDQLRQAYYQGQSQLLATAQYLGRQLFKSQEYISRGRSDHDYVYDLYKGYLQREPDQAGWDYWTGQVPSQGRDNVREAFALSPEFANKVASLCAVGSSGSAPIPLDGLANLSYDPATNRITTAGFQYDAAGNQTRTLRSDGSAQRYQYDAANRLVIVRDDYAYTIATYTYDHDSQRIIAEEGGLRTYYASEGGLVMAEFTESGGSITPAWSKSYIYLGSRLLSVLEPNGSGGERVQYHHPDRLGTRLITNGQDTASFEQVSLPFGTALNSESTGATNRRFTSYERSAMTRLDYAVNRHYDSQQGRFTQVDPIGMESASLENPQTLNLYAYCTNDPINHTDPNGLGFFSWLKKVFKGIGKIFSAVGNAIARVLNNKWVRIAVFILGFILPGLQALGSILYKIVDQALRIYNTLADIGALLQLAGSALQGHWKEFGLSIAVGIVGGAISQIEDALIKGIQDAVFHGGNVFKGAWKGLKTGWHKFWKTLKHAFEKFPKNLIPWYGNFCSPANTLDPGSPNAVDIGDEICSGHDDVSNSRGTGKLKHMTKFESDKQFLRSLFYLPNAFQHRWVPKLHIIDIALGMRPSVGSTYHFMAIIGFSVAVGFKVRK